MAPPQRIESPENKQALDARIQNVVTSGNLGHRIDLDAIVKSFPHVEYNPKRFQGLVFRLKHPKTTTLIFSTGKMICTGASRRSWLEAR